MRDDEHYSLAEFMRLSRLPRSTIRYYEEIGVLTTGDSNEPVYRYSFTDFVRLLNAIILKNMGYTAKEIVQILDEGDLSPEFLTECSETLDKRIAYIEAQKECMNNLAELIKRKDDIWIENVEAYVIKQQPLSWRANENVYHKEEPLYIPISSQAELYEGSTFDSPDHVLKCRAVARRHAPLISGFSDNIDLIGDCLCVRGVMYDTTKKYSLDDKIYCDNLKRLILYAKQQGYTIIDNGFIPYMHWFNGGLYASMCLPVAEISQISFRQRITFQLKNNPLKHDASLPK